MSSVLIAYFTRSGNTEKMAQAIKEAVTKEGVEAVCKPISEVKAEELLKFDGLIFGSPTYYGGMAAEMKALIDESVRYHGRLTGKVGGAFTSSGNIGGGNETTIRAILDAFLIHGMIVQGTAEGDHYGPVAVGAPDARALKGCKALGARVAKLVNRLAG